jgi:hypothetical protein
MQKTFMAIVGTVIGIIALFLIISFVRSKLS